MIDNKSPWAVRFLAVLALMVSVTGSSIVKSAAEDESFYMFNALWFKADGGAARYAEYIEAARPVIEKHGGEIPTEYYLPQQSLIGEFNPDLVFLVKWPGAEAFSRVFEDPEYQAISHLRSEAITDSLLIRFESVPSFTADLLSSTD